MDVHGDQNPDGLCIAADDAAVAEFMLCLNSSDNFKIKQENDKPSDTIPDDNVSSDQKNPECTVNFVNGNFDIRYSDSEHGYADGDNTCSLPLVTIKSRSLPRENNASMTQNQEYCSMDVTQMNDSYVHGNDGMQVNVTEISDNHTHRDDGMVKWTNMHDNHIHETQVNRTTMYGSNGDAFVNIASVSDGGIVCFQCVHCDRKLYTIDEMDVHMKTHTDINHTHDNTSCNECEYHLKQLNNHLQLHHHREPTVTGKPLHHHHELTHVEATDHVKLEPQPSKTQSVSMSEGQLQSIDNDPGSCDNNLGLQSCDNDMRLQSSDENIGLQSCDTNPESQSCNDNPGLESCDNNPEVYEGDVTLELLMDHSILFESREGEPVPHVCMECGACFNSHLSLLHHNNACHLSKTRQDKVYKCGVERCDAVYRSRRTLKLHLFQSHGIGTAFQCEICHKVFSVQSQLNTHVQTHGIEKPFTCDTCERSYQTEALLFRHKKTHDKQFKCQGHCELTFRCKAQFQRHMDALNDIYEEICSHCGKKFTSKFYLNSHLVTHSDEKDYQCQICGAQFARKSQVIRHNLVHTKRDHVCPMCDRAYVNATALNKHLQSHAQKTTCMLCGKKYQQTKGHICKDRINVSKLCQTT